MFFTYGTTSKHLKTNSVKNIACPQCATDSEMKYSVYGRYIHVFWIPVVAIKQKVFVECQHCYKTFEFKELPESFKKKYKQQTDTNPVKTPIWYFSGGVILLGILSFAIYTGIEAKGKEKIYVKNPKSGDVYRINLKDSPNYTTLKVNRVTKDSVTLFVNEYETSGYNGISEIDIDVNYKSQVSISKEHLRKMYADSEIYQIDRD